MQGAGGATILRLVPRARVVLGAPTLVVSQQAQVPVMSPKHMVKVVEEIQAARAQANAALA